MKMIIVLVFISIGFMAQADLTKVANLYKKNVGSTAAYEAMVGELVNKGFYFTAVPWMKEYLVSRSGSLGSLANSSLEKMIEHTGVQLFEKIPERYLSDSKSGFIKYILAKQAFSKGKFEKAIKHISVISSSHAIFPFSLNLKASAYYLLGSYNNALSYYEDCVSAAKGTSTRGSDKQFIKQKEINQESCQAGIARSHFANKNYKKANESYSLIPKDSYIWPELLFEEAWNSFYLKDYNRSLGKVVSYNAPVFKHIFKPEVLSLQAVSLLKLCHYGEAKEIADVFSTKYKKPGELLKKYIMTRKSDYRYYYKLIANFEKNSHLANELFFKVLSSISNGPIYQELKKSLVAATLEKNKLSKENLGQFYGVLRLNIQNTLVDLQQLIGEYVREELIQSYREIYKANQGMSFVRLDILNKRKQQLYGKGDGDKKGDLKNLKRTRFQYFWNFNGEFWADELGDYVFALKSECGA